MQPLSHITVVALEQAVAAPFATRQLADLGARVIKIERPGTGDFARGYDTTVHGMASYFVWLNRSKESITLDLKRPEALDVLERLLGIADVFVQNLAPGAAERMGVGAAALRAKYPRLIVSDISGYGRSGPYESRKAYDLLIQSEAGLLSITGSADAPAKAGISIADIAAGMYAYSGVLTGLINRERTGEGMAFEISMLEALGEWMGSPMYYATYGGAPPARTGPAHASIAPYGPFTSANGITIYLGVQNEPEWRRFCNGVLEQPQLADDPRFTSNAARVRHRVALDALLSAALSRLSADETIRRLEAAQIANGRMNTVEEFASHPQLLARDRWRDVGSPVGPIRALIPPVTIPGIEPRMDPIPAAGEHTESVLRELGFNPERIAGFRRNGII